LLNQAKPKPDSDGKPPRIVVLGVGNELNGDDVAGLFVLRSLQEAQSKGLLPDTWLLLEGGTAPENFTAPIHRFRPDWLLVVDAAQIGCRPGQIAYIGLDEVDGASAFTHGLPLSLIGQYLIGETGCRFGLLGIQVEQTGFGLPPSQAVLRAVGRLAAALPSFA
jgi:hydrogenase 3 maturation protease